MSNALDMLGPDRLARPARPLAEGTNDARRDPRPSWDPWYALPLPARRRLLPFMAPAGHGLQLDEVADLVGAGTLDDAMTRWAAACEMARRGARAGEMTSAEVDEWQAADALAESDAALYGPAELAEMLGTTVANVHQRRHRGQLPDPDLTLSRVPIWSGETLRLWQEWSAA